MQRRAKTASLRHEKDYYAQGCRRIVGLDEAGRGALAGPVVAGAVCLPIESRALRTILKGVRDSKEMTARQRAALSEQIKKTASAWGVGSASCAEIDADNIVHATRLAMQRALSQLLHAASFEPDCLFIDSLLLPGIRHIPQVSMIEGDKRSLSIAAASVLAKVWRDDHMRELDDQYPQYEFAVHKGYGTAKHFAAIKAFGPSRIHRMTFAPLKHIGQDYNDL